MIMESLHKVKHAEQQFKSVVVTYDMTKTARDECKRILSKQKIRKHRTLRGIYRLYRRGLPGKMKIIKIRIRQNKSLTLYSR